MTARLFSFLGGTFGPWRVVRMQTVAGEALATVERLSVFSGPDFQVPEETKWLLRGLTSHERYVSRVEHDQLVARQANLGRPEATCAALIPIRKTAPWWSL